MAILNEYIVSHCDAAAGVIVLLLTSIFGFIIFLCTTISSWPRIDRFEKVALMAFTILFLGTMIGSMIYMGSKKFTVEEKYYDVTLDDISAAELLDKYEVVEKNGKIYTIKERPNDKP